MDADYSQLIDATTKLELLWRQQGISLADRVDEATVRERIAALGKTVSDDVVTLYSVTGGMSDSAMCDAYFTLWSLDRAIEENSGRAKCSFEYWRFADHLISSIEYACVYQTSKQSSVVAFYYPGESIKSPSLQGFLALFAAASSEKERMALIL